MTQKFQLQPPEQERFALLKQTVTDGMAICFIVGAALREIKERKFFLAEGHKTMDDFVTAEWGWTRRYCNQLIVDADAINSLPESMRKLITSHKAAEELAKIPVMLRPAIVTEVAAANGGKVIAAALRKATPPVPSRKAVSATPTASTSASPPQRKKPATGAAAAAKKVISDATGLEVPAESLDLWNRGGAAQEVLTYLSAIRGRIKKAQDEADPLFVEVDFTDSLAKLNQVYEDMKRAKPYAVCPTCQGKLPKGCLSCKGRGFVSEFYWNNAVPAEVRTLRSTIKV
jgi:hypothetical protein